MLAKREIRLSNIGKVLCCLALSISMNAPLVCPSQSSNEAALRALTERFFAVYLSGEIDDLMLLWSEKSPDLTIQRKTFQQTSAENKLELKELTIRRITLNAGSAMVSVNAEIARLTLRQVVLPKVSAS